MATDTSITVIGAGIIGLWQARVLAAAGHRVRIIDASAEPFIAGASQWAGAMLAPDCEAETAPAQVRDWGHAGLAMWRAAYSDLVCNGTLVVAASRDRAELVRFERVTTGGERIDAVGIQKLEPQLAERFSAGIFFADEAHMNAASALRWLLDSLLASGVQIDFGTEAFDSASIVIDCRGMAALADQPELRGVRGERMIVATREVVLHRPVRLLHPRQPIYIVPQGDGRFVVGATVIERQDDAPMTVKSALELLSSAYAVDPAFGEAAIVDIGVGVRPAYPDNLPRIVVSADAQTISVNGAYRHGFLLAPVLAEAVATFLATGKKHPAFH